MLQFAMTGSLKFSKLTWSFLVSFLNNRKSKRKIAYDERRLQFAFVLGGLADPGLMLEFITVQGVCVDVMAGRGQICRGRVGNRAGAGLDHGVGIQQGMR